MYRIELVDDDGNVLPGRTDAGGGVIKPETGKASMLVNDQASHFLHYQRALNPHGDGLRDLHEQHPLDVMEMLEHGVESLGTDSDPLDGHSNHPGNCGYVLMQLIDWIRDNDFNGTFRVTDEF